MSPCGGSGPVELVLAPEVSRVGTVVWCDVHNGIPPVVPVHPNYDQRTRSEPRRQRFVGAALPGPVAQPLSTIAAGGIGRVEPHERDLLVVSPRRCAQPPLTPRPRFEGALGKRRRHRLRQPPSVAGQESHAVGMPHALHGDQVQGEDAIDLLPQGGPEPRRHLEQHCEIPGAGEQEGPLRRVLTGAAHIPRHNLNHACSITRRRR